METNYAKDQAQAQLNSISQMVAALNCDYDRLEELTDMDTDDMTEEEREELKELADEAGDCESREDAEQRIQEDPLSVQIRSGWYSPGETPAPEEFEILLCTGGPAVRILGELGEYNEPVRAWIQYQDWGTPWTDFFAEGYTDTILEYCQQFYFGE